MDHQDGGFYWTSSNISGSAYCIVESVGGVIPTSFHDTPASLPVRCVRNKPVESVPITGDVDGVPITSAINLTIGNTANTITLTKGTTLPIDASNPVQWHWEYTIGDDDSWIVIPNSEGKTTLVTSTHDDDPDNDFVLVGGTNRFRIVAYNLSGTVRSEVISITLKLPSLTYAILGAGTYSWAGSGRQTAITKAIGPGGVLNKDNPNAIIKTEGLVQLWNTSDRSSAANYLANGYTGNGYSNAKPDILLYFAHDAPPDTNAIRSALVGYINAGGTVIYATSDGYGPQTTSMFAQIFGPEIVATNRSTITNPGQWENTVYLINNLPNDPIVNGPFGNLSGGDKYIGDENAGTVYVPTLPEGSIQIASMYTPRTGNAANLATLAASSFAWYNSAKNFFYIGDSTNCRTFTIAVANGDYGDHGEYPAIYNANTGMPGSKLTGVWDRSGYSALNAKMTYNAVLEMNALAWAMTRAARDGINPH
jgi:hypothetical protein